MGQNKDKILIFFLCVLNRTTRIMWSCHMISTCSSAPFSNMLKNPEVMLLITRISCNRGNQVVTLLGTVATRVWLTQSHIQEIHIMQIYGYCRFGLMTKKSVTIQVLQNFTNKAATARPVQWLGYRLDIGGFLIRSRRGPKSFISYPSVQTDSGSHVASYLMVTGFLYPRLKRVRPTDDYSPQNVGKILPLLAA